MNNSILPPLREGDDVMLLDVMAHSLHDENPNWWKGKIIRNNGDGTYDVDYMGSEKRYPETKIRSHKLFNLTIKQRQRLSEIELDFIYNKPTKKNVNINDNDIANKFIQDPDKRHFAVEYFNLERNINDNDLREILLNNEKFYKMVCNYIFRRRAIKEYKMQQWEINSIYRANEIEHIKQEILSTPQTMLASVLSRYGNVNNINNEDVITDVLLEMPKYLKKGGKQTKNKNKSKRKTRKYNKP